MNSKPLSTKKLTAFTAFRARSLIRSTCPTTAISAIAANCASAAARANTPGKSSCHPHTRSAATAIIRTRRNASVTESASKTAAPETGSPYILEVNNLKKYFPIKDRSAAACRRSCQSRRRRNIQDSSARHDHGSGLANTGCGKTTIGRTQFCG